MKSVYALVLAAGVSFAASASADTITCTPNAAADFANRIHVHCTTAVNGISYFALRTTDPNRAARTLALAAGAVLTGRTIDINYDPADLSGASIGCNTNDCRMITWLQLL